MIYTFLLPDNTLISFDAVTEFGETISASVTSYEVEDGYPISDNMVLANPEFSINGILSYYNSPQREIVLVEGEFVLSESSTTSPEKIHVELEERIRSLMKNKTPFSIIKSESLTDVINTEYERVPNCLLKGLNFQYTASESGAVFPKMTIQQVRLSTVEETEMQNATPSLIPKERVSDKAQVAQAKKDASATDPTKDPTKANDGKVSGNNNLAVDEEAKRRTIALEEAASKNQALAEGRIRASDAMDANKKEYTTIYNSTSKSWDVVPK